jgi:hypothetical protein
MGRIYDLAQLKPAMLRECAYQAARIATVAEAVSDLEDLLGDVPREERILPDFRCCGKANRPVPPNFTGWKQKCGGQEQDCLESGCHVENSAAAVGVPVSRRVYGVYSPALLPLAFERFLALVLSNAWQGAPGAYDWQSSSVLHSGPQLSLPQMHDWASTDLTLEQTPSASSPHGSCWTPQIRLGGHTMGLITACALARISETRKLTATTGAT